MRAPQPFATPRISSELRGDGSLLVRAEEPLGPFAPSLARLLRDGAERHPDRPLAKERPPGAEGWRSLTWGEARARADRLGQALLDLGLSAERPLLILSGNSIDHLTMTLAAYSAGVPTVPVSTAYSLLSHDHARLHGIAGLAEPGAVFAEDGEEFGPALDSIAAAVPVQIVGRGKRPDALRLEDLERTVADEGLERAFAAVGPDSVAKILFTSGSTGVPKGVLNTHRMLCSNQQALGQIWPFMRDEPPVLVDWLPWSHTFGGNHNVNQALAFGGTLHIDDGRPTPAGFERTVEALREVSPTVYYNVPAGYALLAPRLEADPDLARTFFARLRFMLYAAAPLPEPLWARLHSLAAEVADHPVPLTASWGTTETAPGATSAHFDSAVCGCIGVPLPGVELKLVPSAEKREIRLRGPNVTPGYLGAAATTAAAFDEEGFYLTGDAVTPCDETDLSQGLMFDGRLAEDFKLVTGTWVHVGELRSALLAGAGVLADAVIAGQGRESIGALAWLDPASAGRGGGEDPELAADLARALARLNAGQGSARRVERLLLMSEPASPDAGEVTDKGYVNQRIVLERRADLVARLFADPPDPEVIVPAAAG